MKIEGKKLFLKDFLSFPPKPPLLSQLLRGTTCVWRVEKRSFTVEYEEKNKNISFLKMKSLLFFKQKKKDF